jgi:hypothetical protein
VLSIPVGTNNLFGCQPVDRVKAKLSSIGKDKLDLSESKIILGLANLQRLLRKIARCLYWSSDMIQLQLKPV